jgi:hypothetical protein
MRASADGAAQLGFMCRTFGAHLHPVPNLGLTAGAINCRPFGPVLSMQLGHYSRLRAALAPLELGTISHSSTAHTACPGSRTGDMVGDVHERTIVAV